MKKCTKCGDQKPLSEFHKNKNAKDNLVPHCKACAKMLAAKWYKNNSERVIARTRAWNENNKDKVRKAARNYHVKTKYGITFEKEQQLKIAQNNKCAICQDELGIKHRSHIDHSHKTGEIRGVLCHLCNVLLGQARDSIDILKSAQKYLQKHNKKATKK